MTLMRGPRVRPGGAVDGGASRSSGQPTSDLNLTARSEAYLHVALELHYLQPVLYLRPAMSTSADRVAQRAAERVDALGASLRTAAEWADRT
jgi:hypothetical protein